MRRLPVVLAVLACGGCSGSVQFRGPATYVVSTPNEPSRTGAVDQSGLLCTTHELGKVVLRLGDGCVLYAFPQMHGRGAWILAGQRCLLPLSEGNREVVVRTGLIVADAAHGVDVTLGTNPVDAPASYLAYRLTAGPLLPGDDACDALLGPAPSRETPEP
jgi:hypothetical protein